jgi:hypothetical protein
MTSPNEGFHRKKDTMAFDHDDHEDGVSRRRALKQHRMFQRHQHADIAGGGIDRADEGAAGGFIAQSLVALWLFQKFEMSVAAASQFFFWSGVLSAFSCPVAALPVASASSTRWSTPTSPRASA